MKKVFLALVIAMVIAASVPALDLNLNIGLLSGVGVSHDSGRWQFGLDAETTFPVYAVVEGIMESSYEDVPFRQGFRTGLTYFFGADLYTYFRLFQDDGYRMYAGLDLMFGTETAIRSFEAVLRPTVKFSYDIGRCGLFLAAGFSLLDIMHVPGFRKPLVRVPNANYASILTGCRVGLSIALN
ncbi:MAG: hypothetical protein IJ863_02195 [Spirochaetales bacterium]|nr:hypothetical protein [Spirochaetales bacterium]